MWPHNHTLNASVWKRMKKENKYSPLQAGLPDQSEAGSLKASCSGHGKGELSCLPPASKSMLGWTSGTHIPSSPLNDVWLPSVIPGNYLTIPTQFLYCDLRSSLLLTPLCILPPAPYVSGHSFSNFHVQINYLEKFWGLVCVKIPLQ